MTLSEGAEPETPGSSPLKDLSRTPSSSTTTKAPPPRPWGAVLFSVRPQSGCTPRPTPAWGRGDWGGWSIVRVLELPCILLLLMHLLLMLPASSFPRPWERLLSPTSVGPFGLAGAGAGVRARGGVRSHFRRPVRGLRGRWPPPGPVSALHTPNRGSGSSLRPQADWLGS